MKEYKYECPVCDHSEWSCVQLIQCPECSTRLMVLASFEIDINEPVLMGSITKRRKYHLPISKRYDSFEDTDGKTPICGSVRYSGNDWKRRNRSHLGSTFSICEKCFDHWKKNRKTQNYK